MMTNVMMGPDKAPKRTVELLKWLNFIVLFVLSFSGLSQNTNGDLISGRVLDTDGVPLPGATVVVVGTNNGTVTDFDGNFEIAISGEYYQLEFRYVGYEPQVVDARDQSNIEVTLEFDQNSLDEVVVIGYGEQSKRNVTGAISKISMEDTEDLPNLNIGQAIRGRAAGVQFTDSGRPGQNGSILIRGTGSLSANNNPLIVLDGIFYNGSIAEINPNDIQSMEVLKDASASAIYGSRAANGVILITSKKGTTDKPTIKVNYFSGLSTPSYRPKLLSPERYLEKSMDIRRQQGYDFDPNDVSTYLTATEAENYLQGNIVDPYKGISQAGSISSLDVSMSGRTDRTNYYVSGSFSEEKGLVKDDNFSRASFKLNMENNINDWIKVGINTMFSELDQSGVPATVSYIERQSPYGTWFREDGTPTQFTVPEDEGISRNPLRESFLTLNQYVRNNLFANFYSVIDIPKIEGLTFRINYSTNYRWIRDYESTAQDIYLSTNTVSASKRNWRANDWVVENILNYSKKFGNDHALDVTLMYGSNKNRTESTTANSEQLESDALGWNSLELGTIFSNFSEADQVTGTSSMARLNYKYKDRYLLTLTARRDGSSVFARNNKYATFPSAALSWILTEEPFMKQVDFLDFAKIRVSHGAVGNQAITPYQSLSLSGTTNYVFGDGGGSSLGIYPSNISNHDLKWETTEMSNIGVDFSLFDSRVSGTVELYNNKTKDLLVERSIPIATGYNSIWTNIGEVNNRGIEVSLSSVNIKGDKFSWSTDFVFSHNKNKIVSLYGADNDGDGREDDDIGNSWFIGEPISSFYDFVFDGIYQVGDDDIPAGSQPGFAKFRDIDGDGDVNAQNDRGIVGQGDPKYIWSVNNTFSYGDLELSIFVNAMQGWIGRFNQLDHYYTGDPMRPVNMYDAGWWTQENASNTRPSLLYNRSTLGHSWYRSRDFIRIQDISLRYKIPQPILDKLQVSNLSFYLTGKNLFTFTDWLGTNPETITSYPLSRSIALGINLGF